VIQIEERLTFKECTQKAEFRRPNLATRALFAFAALVANVVLLGGGLSLFEMQAEKGARQLADARTAAAASTVAACASQEAEPNLVGPR
jgi:hypothetical protein